MMTKAGMKAVRAVTLLIVLGGFALGGAPGAGAAALPKVNQAPAAVTCSLGEGFDVWPPAGWTNINHSEPVGIPSWRQGAQSNIFPPVWFIAQSGPEESYAGVDYDSTDTLGTISDWLISPPLNFRNGDIVQFFTRAGIPNNPATIYPDRLELRLSTAGDSLDIGTGAFGTGVFALLLSINPTLQQDGYPYVWTAYSVILTGLSVPVQGRLAFRYFVENGGSDGENSYYIGVDTVSVCRNNFPVYIPAVLR